MTDLAKRSKRKTWRRERAHLRVRSHLAGTAERPRLSVFKSLRYVYAQLVDDGKGVTLAERAKTAGIDKGVFDRGGYVYHGKVKALAEAAREKGLEF